MPSHRWVGICAGIRGDYHFPPVTTTRLYVGNLSNDITESALREMFSAHGRVLEVHVVQDRYTGRSRGFAFVAMATPEEAATAALKMNGTLLHGRLLHVSEGSETAGADRGKPPAGRG